MLVDEVFEFTVDSESGGERLDLTIAVSFEDMSRSYIQKLIEAGRVEVNGEECRVKKRKLSAGDFVRLVVPQPEEIDAAPEDIPVDIVYEDDEVLVVDKAKGMVVHPAPGNEGGTLVNAVMYHCRGKLSSINGKVRPGIVHRLDKDTSGLLVIAKTDSAHRALAEQLAAGSVKRVYSAIVYNNFSEDEGVVDEPIGRDPKNRLRQAVTKVNSRRAVTRYKVLERFGKFTHIEARLETGRTHQIRVHMAYIKHPVLGDALYGPARKVFLAETQALHAKLLGFIHPKTGEHLEFESSLPKDFERILDKLRGGHG